ncbi:MAG: hypothetical protein WCO00_16055 [Rhodospirillaceae bacterium]
MMPTKKYLSLLLASSLTLSACASTGGQDQGGCSGAATTTEERQLCADNEVFNQTIWGGVAQGALIGAGIAGLGCALFGGRTKNCLIAAGAGAAVGGAVGGLDGYSKAKEEEATKQNIRKVDAIANDLRTENARLAASLANARTVVKTDRARLAQLQRQVAAGQTSLAQARAERDRVQKHKETLDSMIANLEKRQDDYITAKNTSGESSRDYEAQAAQLSRQIADLKSQRDALSATLNKSLPVS